MLRWRPDLGCEGWRWRNKAGTSCLCSWTGVWRVVKVSHLPKLIYRFSAISSRNYSRVWVQYDKQIFKFIWKSKGLRMAECFQMWRRGYEVVGFVVRGAEVGIPSSAVKWGACRITCECVDLHNMVEVAWRIREDRQGDSTRGAATMLIWREKVKFGFCLTCYPTINSKYIEVLNTKNIYFSVCVDKPKGRKESLET